MEHVADLRSPAEASGRTPPEGESIFAIGASGADAARIVAEIQAAVAEKRRRGLYHDPLVTKAELANLANLQDDQALADVYLETLRDAVFVDIGDFEIFERRARLGFLLKALKRLIWNLLKFYTYRLWSQQNQVNGLLLAAVEGIEDKNRAKLQSLEERVARLERGADGAERP
jgi:hypothetical protein